MKWRLNASFSFSAQMASCKNDFLCTLNIQLFWERLSEKVYATTLKGIVDSTAWPVLQWNLKECMTQETIDVSLWVLKESNKSIFNSYNVRNSVLIVSHITLQDCRVHSFSHNLSQNSCKLTIVVEEALICWLVFLCNRWCTSFWHFQLDLIAWVTIIRVLNLKVKTKKFQTHLQYDNYKIILW